MPNVNAPVRLMQSGEAITQFTDTASTTATTFTYPNQQEGLSVSNKGVATITLTVNGTNYTIQPGQNQSISAVFISFSVQSMSGTQQFEASAWSIEKDEAQVTITSSKVIFGDDPRGLIPISDPIPLTIPTYDGSGQIVHPSVVYIPAGFGGYKFWMVMTPYPNSDATKENPSIVASNDGINWVVPAGLTNPVIPQPGTSNNSDPHLEYDRKNGKLVMYYQFNGDGLEYRVESTNGTTWTAPVSIGDIFTSPSCIKVNDTTNDWVVLAPVGNGTKIMRKESADGLTFGAGFPVNFPNTGNIGHAWFGIDNVGWHGLVTISSMNRYYADCDLYYAFSNNGFDWKVFPSPVVSRTLGNLRGRSVYRSCMVNLGEVVRIYYSAWGFDGKWHVGYVDCKYGFKTTRVFEGQALIPLFNQVSIRDAIARYGFGGGYGGDSTYVVDWNNYKNKSLVFSNSLDQPVKLNFVSNFRGDLTLINNYDQLNRYNAGTPQAITYTLPAGSDYSPVLITTTDAPILGTLIPSKMAIQAKCDIAPTAGKLSMYLLMWN